MFVARGCRRGTRHPPLMLGSCKTSLRHGGASRAVEDLLIGQGAPFLNDAAGKATPFATTEYLIKLNGA